MTLAEELENEKQGGLVNRCKVCQWMSGLDESDLQAYREWLDSYGDMAKLYRAATRIDPPVPGAYSTFSRHIRECKGG